MKNKKRIIFSHIFLIAGLILLFQKCDMAAETVSETSLRPSVIEYSADKLKDPFQGLKVKLKKEPELTKEQTPAIVKPLPTLRVQGLIWGAIPQAIIENKIYSIGDKIGNFTVLDISNDGVTISFENERYTLPSPVDEELKKKIEKELKEKKLKEEQDEK